MQTISSRTLLAYLTLGFCLIVESGASMSTFGQTPKTKGEKPPVAGNSRPPTNAAKVKSNLQNRPLRFKTEVISLRIEPQAINFDTPIDFQPEAKRVVISNADVSGQWTFIRFNEWDKHLELKVASAALNNQTAEQGQLVLASQWLGFRNRIDLDVTLTSSGDNGFGVLALQLEKGSAQLTEDTLRAANDAIREKRITPTEAWNDVVTVQWQPAANIAGVDGWSSATRMIIWSAASILGLLIIGLALKFTGLFPKVIDKIEESWYFKWRELEHRFEKPKTSLTPPAGSGVGFSGTQLMQDMRDYIKQEQQEQQSLATDLKKHLASSRQFLESSVNSSLHDVKKELLRIVEFGPNARLQSEDIRSDIARLRENTEEQRNWLEDTLRQSRIETGNAIVMRISEQQQQLGRTLSEILQKVEERREPDLTYARMLGSILGKNVDALAEDNFREFGDALNRFFREQVPQPDEGLERIRARANDICLSLEVLLVKARSLSTSAEAELTPHAGRARQIGNEINSVYFQLRSRQLNLLLTDLRIPVAAHASARDGFLEELGAALKREIEKLRDPRAYFELQLRRLATSEIVAITDICDKKLRRVPGGGDEIEAALSTLFERSSLKPILPQQLDEYQPSIHDFVELVPSPDASKNRRVAKVVSRGFFYEQDSHSHLLRKAGVAIYG